MTILVTGAAGFIGYHVAAALIARGDRVIGIDNMNSYYDPMLKKARIAALQAQSGDQFIFRVVDFADREALETAIVNYGIDRVVHLGAQAGVRYSLENPHAYVQSNLVGHINLLEFARHTQVSHMVYASSSSVYGANAKQPFSVEDRVDHPLSLYAATKKADELMSETYAHLYRIPLTGLRFFTVYGPWGRPDMAMWLFADAILNNRPIKVFNNGDMRRDFTYIDDIVAGVIASLDSPPIDDGRKQAGGSIAPHRIFNIGNSRAEHLGTMIEFIERACGKPAIREMLPIQPGDVPATYADIQAISAELGYSPTTRIEDGIPRFVDWFKSYHGY